MNNRMRHAFAMALGVALSCVGIGVCGAQSAPGKGLSALQKRHVSGAVSLALESAAAANSVRSPAQRSAILGAALTANVEVNPLGECDAARGSNKKVNQNCHNLGDFGIEGRGQSQNETAIAQDPNAPTHLVAAFNDYRRGDTNCGAAWSVDGGKDWQDSTLPTGFVGGTPYAGVARQYFQAASDPAVAWDTKGNAYLSCDLFMRGLGISRMRTGSSSSTNRT